MRTEPPASTSALTVSMGAETLSGAVSSVPVPRTAAKPCGRSVASANELFLLPPCGPSPPISATAADRP